MGLFIALGCILCVAAQAEDQWAVYDGFDGPGKGKHIVFVTGDEEYRSEEAMPQMAKILAIRHGFKCTVLFAINKETGEIDPNTLDNISGLEILESADLMVVFTRSRRLPDEQMEYIIDFTNSGKPMIFLRTATHGFRTNAFEGGFGRAVVGEGWVDHWGDHGSESTRGVIAEGMEDHPIVSGCEDIWGPTDVYEVGTLSGDSKPVIMGEVVAVSVREDLLEQNARLARQTGMTAIDPLFEVLIDESGPDRPPRLSFMKLDRAHLYRQSEEIGSRRHWVGTFEDWMDSETERGRISTEEKAAVLAMWREWDKDKHPIRNADAKRRLTEALKYIVARPKDEWAGTHNQQSQPSNWPYADDGLSRA